MHKLFSDIGKKLQTLAGVITIAGIILSVILGIVLIALGSWVTGLIYIVVGTLASWIGSWILYGFGEIIIKLKQIAENTENQNNSQADFAYGQTVSFVPDDVSKPKSDISNLH